MREDSNLRYLIQYVGFQNRDFKPLRHSSTSSDLGFRYSSRIDQYLRSDASNTLFYNALSRRDPCITLVNEVDLDHRFAMEPSLMASCPSQCDASRSDGPSRSDATKQTSKMPMHREAFGQLR